MNIPATEPLSQAHRSSVPDQAPGKQPGVLSLDTIWLLVLPVGLFCLLNLVTQVYPNDFWWHVRVGQLTFDEGRIPSLDSFSFTRAGNPWVNQAWLMQLALYGLYRAGGLPLVILAHALTITAGYSLLLRAVTRSYGLRSGVLAALIGAAVGVLNWTPRPQTISFLFFGCLVYLIESHRHGQSGRLWWALPLFSVWANAHGGFVFGLALLGLYVVARLWAFWRGGRPAQERAEVLQLAGLGLLAWAAVMLNPQGPLGIARYVLSFVKSEATTQYNLEFMPLVIRQLDGALFYAATLGLVLSLAMAGWRVESDHALNLVVFGALALLARRNAPWYGFTLAAPLAAAWQARWRAPQTAYTGKAWLNAMIIGLMVVGMLISLPWLRGTLLKERDELVTDTTPLAAAAFLCDSLPDDARVYQYLAFSSYQVWACPRLPVFIDTRFELYPIEQWLDYMAVENARFDWEDVLARYKVTHLFLSIEFQEQLVRAASNSDCWHELMRDEYAIILEKTDCSK